MAVRLDDGTWGQGGEELRLPIVDRFKSLSTTLKHTLFQAAIGATRDGVKLSAADTNTEKGESIPKSQKWELDLFEFFFLPTAALTAATMQNVLDAIRETVVTCVIESKDKMFSFPLWKMFGSFPNVLTPAATINSLGPIAPIHAAYKLDVPIVLESNTSWRLDVEHVTAPSANIDGYYFAFSFDSIRYRKD